MASVTRVTRKSQANRQQRREQIERQLLDATDRLMSDGTSFTELLPARPPRKTATESAPKRKREKPAAPVLVEVTGEGFVPGEDVACCLIVSHTDATPHGTARALLDPKQATGADGVVLVGRISGTVVTRSLP